MGMTTVYVIKRCFIYIYISQNNITFHIEKNPNMQFVEHKAVNYNMDEKPLVRIE